MTVILGNDSVSLTPMRLRLAGVRQVTDGGPAAEPVSQVIILLNITGNLKLLGFKF